MLHAVAYSQPPKRYLRGGVSPSALILQKSVVLWMPSARKSGMFQRWCHVAQTRLFMC